MGKALKNGTKLFESFQCPHISGSLVRGMVLPYQQCFGKEISKLASPLDYFSGLDSRHFLPEILFLRTYLVLPTNYQEPQEQPVKGKIPSFCGFLWRRPHLLHLD